MDKHKSRRILKFLETMETTGLVSKDEVLTLENALGENLITSSINLKELSSTPSKSSYDDIYNVIKKVVKSENITTGDIISLDAAATVKRTALYNLKNIRQHMRMASEVFTIDVKNKMLDSKDRYSFYNEKGILETNSYDVLTDYSGPRAILFNSKYVSGFTKLPTDKIDEYINSTLPPMLRDRYSDSWYNFNIYGLSAVLLNNDFVNIINGLPNAQTEITGKSYITILENSEAIIETLSRLIANLETDITNIYRGTNNNQFIELNYLISSVKKLEKFNTLCSEDKSTLPTLSILTNLLSQ